MSLTSQLPALTPVPRSVQAVPLREPTAGEGKLARSLLLTTAFLPKLGCPLCWPAIAALCTFLGLEFTLVDRAFTAATAVALCLAAALAVRRRKTTAWLTLASLAGLLAFRLGFTPVWTAYAATGGLLLAAAAGALELRPRRHCTRKLDKTALQNTGPGLP